MQANLTSKQNEDAVMRGGDMRGARNREADDEAVMKRVDIQGAESGGGWG